MRHPGNERAYRDVSQSTRDGLYRIHLQYALRLRPAPTRLRQCKYKFLPSPRTNSPTPLKAENYSPPRFWIMVSNKGLIFKKAPTNWPVAGEHIAVEAREFNLDASAPPNGITVKNIYVSFDPYQRGGLREPDKETYFPPFVLGQAITSGAVSKVIKSNDLNFQPNDTVLGVFGTEQYSAVSAEYMFMVRKLENPYNLNLRLFVGALGVAGLTAYYSFYEIGKPQKGNTIFLSSASGAVGQLVGQMAKMEGLTVLGSVGSDAKLDYILKDLGFDGGFNYKTEDTGEALARLAPSGLDIYYDNVGGEQLDAALLAMKDYGRVGKSTDECMDFG